MQLKDKRIALCITRRVEKAIESIVKLGGKPYVEDVVKIVALPDEVIKENIKNALFEAPEIFYFTTGEGTDILLKKSKEIGLYEPLLSLMEKGKVFARGYKVRARLINYGFKNFQSVESTRAFMNMLKDIEISNTKILVQMYGEEMHELEEFLNNKGAKMLKLWLYKYEIDTERLDAFIRKILKGFYHAVLFISAYQLEYIFKRAKEKNLGKELSNSLNNKVFTIAVGRKTAEKLFENGVLRVYYPEKERLTYALRELEKAFKNG
ncbi:uroporphyrinogen-III synthase [Sulfurihydrogenibium azorense]|uniref:uroporphyrinogen-III synthase n=1 Tax=Sulfurihydrogenibium azorense TaxID=309806 RepID=UPI00391B55C6